MAYKILVTWNDGTEEYLNQGLGDRPAVFRSKREAEEQAEFMRMGMDDECESIDVVEE